MEATLEISDATIKSEFHKLIDEIQDVAYLKKLYECMVDQFKEDDGSFDDYDMTQFEKSMQEVKEGKFYTHEQIKEASQQWLTR